MIEDEQIPGNDKNSSSEGKEIANFTIPLKLVSELNRAGEHWLVKSKRHKQQKWLLRSYWPKIEVKLPCRVVITRIGIRMLDTHDNLPASCKWVVDACASEILGFKKAGQGDDDPRIKWEYKQEKGSYSVRIQIFERGEK